MVSPDDIASLKVAVQKLEVALEGFSLKLAAQGMVNYSNTTLDAQQVFDKLSEPILSPNLDQVAVTGDDHSVLNDIDELQPGVNGVREPKNDDIVPDYVRAAHNQFHKTPIPEFILQMAKAAETTHGENEEMVVSQGNVYCSKLPSISQESNTTMGAHKVFDKIPEPNTFSNQPQNVVTDSAHKVLDELSIPTFILEMAQAAKIAQQNEEMVDAHQVFDKIPEPISLLNQVHTECDWVKESQLSSAQKLLDELPLPLFIKEMAQVASVVNESIPTPEIAEIKKVQQDDDLEYKRLMFTSMALSDGSYFPDLITIGDLCPECPYLQEAESWGIHSCFWDCSLLDSSLWEVNSETRAITLVGYIVWLLLNDIELTVNSRLSTILGVFSVIRYQLENDWRSHSNFKEVNSWNKRLTCIDYGMIESTLQPLNHGDQILMELVLMRCWYMFSDTCCSGSVGVTFQPIPIFQRDANPCTTWNSIPCDPGILVTDLLLLVFTYTLEDKGVFRGDEGISREQTWLLLYPLVLWSNYNASRMRKSAVFLTRVFDPGGLWDALLHSSWCSNPNLGLCMSYLMICVIYELGNCNAWLLLLPNTSYSKIMAMINAFSLVHKMVLNIKEGETVQFLIWEPGDTIVIVYELVRKLYVSRDSLVVVRHEHEIEFSNENVIIMKCWVRLIIEDGTNYWKSTTIAATFSQIKVCVPVQLLQSDHVGCIGKCCKQSFQVRDYDPNIMMVVEFTPSAFGADQLELILHIFILANCNSLGFINSVSYDPLTKFQHDDTPGKDWFFIACDGIFLATDASSSFIAYNILFRVFDLGGMKGFNIMSTFKLFKENSRWGKECTRSSCYFSMIMAISSFIFGPGGSYDCRPEMKNLLAYQCKGNNLEEKTYEDNQHYVFDPGGLLRIQVINAHMKGFLIRVEVSCSAYISIVTYL